MIGLKLKIAFKSHGMSEDLLIVKNNKGKVKPLGVWNEEELYSRFKTLGAKRYLTECDGKLTLTVAGLNKKTGITYLQNKYRDKVFDYFDNDMYIPEDSTGKLTHTYIDIEMSGELEDYLGIKDHFYERSGTHLNSCEFSLKLSDKYLNFLLGIKEYMK